MGILDMIESKPDFFRKFWGIPAYPGEPECHRHRLSYAIPLRSRWSSRERLHGSSGSGLSEDEAVKACLGEAVERYSGYRPDRRRIRIASWRDLAGEALHPEQLPGYSAAQMRRKSFHYKPFTEKTKVGWIRGTSLIRNKEIWVPTQFVFLSRYLKGEAPVSPTVSTGLAAGPSREHAALHALYEVLERDAFSILWMNKLSRPLVDLKDKTADSHPVKKLMDEKLARPHLEYLVVDMTTDLGIPAYCAFVRQVNHEWPNFVIGCSCRLNASHAVQTALLEAVTGRSVLLYGQKFHRKFTEGISVHRAFRKVRRVEDHALVYADPRFAPYAAFMTASRKRIPLSALPDYSKNDPQKDLETCLEILKSKGMDAIAVDITPKEVASYGVTVMRVVIPQAQPLHFGWHAERLRNKRLYEVPKLLGYTKHSTTEREIYRIPHPMM